MKTRLFFAITLLTIIFSGCTRIKPGNIGFKYDYGGNEKGRPKILPAVGWVGYTPGFSTVIEFPTSMQHYVWTEQKTESSDENEEIVIACKGGAGFKCDVGFNYTVIPDSAAFIYFKYKTDDLETITKTYLHTTVRNAMAQASGVITLDSMLNNIPLFEKTVDTILSALLVPQGFHLEQFSLVSAPRPIDQNILAAINNKIKAKQDAETKQQELQSSVADANKRIAEAKGDSASRVIRALGEAEAINKTREVLTPEYVEYIKWNKWNGQLPTTMLGAGTNILYSEKGK